MNRAITLFLVVVCVACAVAAQRPIQPQFIPVNVPGDLTHVIGVNDSGIMVGEYYAQGKGLCFVIVGDKVITLGTPRSSETACMSINSSGAIAGTYFRDLQTGYRGFLYQDGHFTDIGPGAGYAQAWGINNSGEIVGFYQSASGTLGFLWDGTSYQTLQVPDSTITLAYSINDLGQVALVWADANNVVHSSIYDGTTYTQIPDHPNAAGTYAYGINNAGDLAVTWQDNSKGILHGALFHDGQYYPFQMPGFGETLALGINNKDVIVGYADNVRGSDSSGYKAIP